MSKQKIPAIKMIDIDKIHILNPRVRNPKLFQAIADNIAQVGLKRPITVRSESEVNGKDYDLVCGQGRLEAFLQAGKKQIPAIVIDASEEQALVMSLVENMARRHHRATDILQGVEILKRQGYSVKTISNKTGLTVEYIYDVLLLLEQGEQRLLAAVEAGNMPITVAVTIAKSPNDSIQQALQDAYDNNLLRGRKLLEAKKLLELRKRFGKASGGGGYGRHRNRDSEHVSAREVLKIYEKEVSRKRLLTRKADATSSCMVFIIEALRHLMKDKAYRAILESEGLTAMPKRLSELCGYKPTVTPQEKTVRTA
jgi:ParB family chromosome partitioning protein